MKIQEKNILKPKKTLEKTLHFYQKIQNQKPLLWNHKSSGKKIFYHQETKSRDVKVKILEVIV